MPHDKEIFKDDCYFDDLHDRRCDKHSFTIYVGGDPDWSDFDATEAEPGVEHRMADRLDLNLHALSSIDPDRPILIQIASCGGSWDEGMQMFGAILCCPNPVTVIATKWARSMTSIIPLAADKFVIRPPAQYMIHHGEFAWHGLAGEEAQTAFEELQASRAMMLDIYTQRLSEQGKHCKKPRKKIRKVCERKMQEHVDFWLTGDAAVEWGFIDEVFTGDYTKLRAKKRNDKRRDAMLDVVRR